jgi:hypothetical protein
VKLVDELVASGIERGLAGPSVLSRENVATIPTSTLGEQIGVLVDHQEQGSATRSAPPSAFGRPCASAAVPLDPEK